MKSIPSLSLIPFSISRPISIALIVRSKFSYTNDAAEDPKIIGMPY